MSGSAVTHDTRAHLERQVAVALRYFDEEAAPRVLAKGFGHVARGIVELAQQAGIELHSDADLARALSRLDVNAEIPPELYEAVARVLSFIYVTNERARRASK